MELSSEKKQIPLTRIQKLINKRMLESKRTKPCFYIESDADVTELMGLRSKLKKSLGVRITSNAFLIRAMALAVKEYPLMLGTLQGRLDDEDAVRSSRIRAICHELKRYPNERVVMFSCFRTSINMIRHYIPAGREVLTLSPQMGIKKRGQVIQQFGV